MKLLIVTQAIDKHDPILGFFHRWVEEFAKHCESIIVICLREGSHDLPNNVKVFSLGKERGASRLKYLTRFYTYIWKFRKEYDSVFVHMNQIYVLLGGILWRIWNKKIGLWYTHKSVTPSLRVTEKVVHVIFTASKESFRLVSKKVRIVGHGIDTDLFSPDVWIKKKAQILTVGRVSKTKNIIKMLDLLEKHSTYSLMIIGSPVTPVDQTYNDALVDEAQKRGLFERVTFLGSVTQKNLPDYYREARVFVNLSETGSLDKAVLEALAMNVPVYTTNEAFTEGAYPVFQDFEKALEQGTNTRDYIIQNHSLDTLISRMIDILRK